MDMESIKCMQVHQSEYDVEKYFTIHFIQNLTLSWKNEIEFLKKTRKTAKNKKAAIHHTCSFDFIQCTKL